MRQKLTALACVLVLLFASCSKEVKAPTPAEGKLVFSEPVVLALNAATSGVYTIRTIYQDLTYTNQEPCSGQLFTATGRKTVTYQYNPNTGLTKISSFLQASGTLQNGEKVNLSGKFTEELRQGETTTYTESVHYNTSNHGGTLNVTVSGYLASPTEFIETDVHWIMNCG